MLFNVRLYMQMLAVIWLMFLCIMQKLCLWLLCL